MLCVTQESKHNVKGFSSFLLYRWSISLCCFPTRSFQITQRNPGAELLGGRVARITPASSRDTLVEKLEKNKEEIRLPRR